jgi:hypothetical protein
MTARIGQVIAIAVAGFALISCRRIPSTSGPFPQDIYVWQRAWTPEVAEGLTLSRDAARSFVVFSGQITLSDAAPKFARPGIDYRRLKFADRPVGLAIRVDPYSGPFRSDDDAIRSIAEFVRERLDEARKNGVEPTELHFDFDCAAAKLDGYRIWLREVRNAVKPLPVYPTVLPSWLGRQASADSRTKVANSFYRSIALRLRAVSRTPNR